MFENNLQIKISKNELLELFLFCISKTNFLFDGIVDANRWYSNGVTIGPNACQFIHGSLRENLAQ